MDLGLSGKVALVTGASKGIGRGIAAELVAEGARVAISSHSRERVEATGAEIGATAYVHDTSDLDHAATLVTEVEQGLGPIDVLTQISAVQAALDKVALGLLDDHARHCVMGSEGGQRVDRTDEMMAAVGRLMRRG